MTRAGRGVAAAVALLAGTGSLLGFAAGGAPAQGHLGAAGVGGDPAAGSRLFAQSCASCHGADARGIPGVAPSLRGVGALATDFYLRTGRMPLRDPTDQPRRTRSPFTPGQIADLVAYVGGFGGPAIPRVDPARGSLPEGRRLFAERCAGCHQIVGRGGITTGAFVPDLQEATPVDVAEALAVGPYVMPSFAGQLDQRQLDSLTRYVLSTRAPDNAGGWGLGNVGPIPEGMVTWLLAAVALLAVMRLLGERTGR